MASRKSAFSVFRGKERSKKDSDMADDLYIPGTSSPTLKRRQGSLPDVSKIDANEKVLSLTPPTMERMSKRHNKNEVRFNSFRKSLRKRSKKDPQYEVNLKDKENLEEKLQTLDGLSLEEKFLPEVIKQRKEQENLHKAESVNSRDQNSVEFLKVPKNRSPKIESRKRCNSSPDTSVDFNGRQVLPSKKHFIEKARKRAHSLTEVRNDDYKVTHSADKLFEWLIAPITSDQFFSEVWQKKPLFIKRRQPKYNQIWFSTKELDRILRLQNVQFTKNLDIAVYRNGKRETLNPEGRAFAPAVWKFYDEGCSVRLLNPQTYSKNVWHLNSKLQEHFGCFVGANVYLTPPGSQGFAPHYDDIEAFVIQLEGKKHWKLYPARDAKEMLPRYSSKNLPSDELREPILDRIVEPGDTLYFPRGVIHQAVTPDDSHSLHITLSFYQKYCWSDYIEKLIPMALQTAIEEDVEFRRGLPIGCHSHVGISNSDKSTPERKAFIQKVEHLMKKMITYASVDLAADELVLDQMDEFLPPCLTNEECECSVYGNGSYWDNGQVRGHYKLDLDTEVKIIRPGVARLTAEEKFTHIHYTVENSRQYKEVPLKHIQIPVEMAGAAEFLLLSHPEYVKVKDVPLESDEGKISLAKQLYDLGLLRTKEPLATDLQSE